MSRLSLNPWLPGVLVEGAARAFLLRGEGCLDDPNEAYLGCGPPECEAPADWLVLSSIGPAGALGEGAQLSEQAAMAFDLIARPGGLAAIWTEATAPEQGLFFATFDENGGIAQGRTTVQAGNALSQPKLARSSEGYAAFFAGGSRGSYSLQVAFLDEAGALVGAPKIVQESSAFLQLGAVSALPEGYALTYSTYENDVLSYLVLVDAEGNGPADPIQLGDATGFPIFTEFTPSLLVRGEELIVAFARQDGDYENEDVALTVHLARMDTTSGSATVSALSLQAPVVGEENTQPALIGMGDDIGLIWSRGSVIYSCSGCTPDNHLEFVVLDGEDFTPLSERVTFENPFSRGGLILPDIVRQGDTVLVASTLQRHIEGEGAFGNLTCTPTD